MNHSPQETGDSNLAKVESYLSRLKADGGSLPSRNGKVNIDQLAKACGLSTRQPFYTNKAIKAALAVFAGGREDPEPSLSRKETDELRSKLLRAEQQLATLRAENDLLKEQNRELALEHERRQAVQEVALLGRRVIV